MEVRFPGGLRVEASQAGFRISTDQPTAQGGGGTAPSPFDLFLASIATCSGFYALRFLQQRGLETEGLALEVDPQREPGGKHVVRVRIAITPPPSFPEKYRDALVRAVDQCTVKKHLMNPPEFEIAVGAPEAASVGPAIRAGSPAPV